VSGMPSVTIRKGTEGFMVDAHEPGTWWVWKTETTDVPLICCPQCKGIINMGADHAIAEDGTVTPSCKCLTSYCSFHANVRLERWRPPAPPKVF